MTFSNLFTPRNRGILLDVLVFIFNIVIMRMMTGYVVGLFRNVDDPFAQLSLGLFFAGMLFLPAAGAILKRWHFHQRHNIPNRRTSKGVDGHSDIETDPSGSCLFNPIFYLCTSLCISVTAGTFLFSQIFGADFDRRPGIFVSLIFGSITLSIVQTVLVYRYFSTPKKAPRIAFLLDPRSELLGDACLYLNMLLFQALWNIITSGPGVGVASFSEFVGRLFVLSFAALLIYFPPRIFYLADDIQRPTARLTILLANAPVLLRTLIGSSTHI
jgi:hypothetical protein